MPPPTPTTPSPHPDSTYQTLDLVMWLLSGTEKDTLLCLVVFLIITPHCPTSAPGWLAASLLTNSSIRGRSWTPSLQNGKDFQQPGWTNFHPSNISTDWLDLITIQTCLEKAWIYRYIFFHLKSSPPLPTLSAVMHSWLLLGPFYRQNAIKAGVINWPD